MLDVDDIFSITGILTRYFLDIFPILCDRIPRLRLNFVKENK